MKHSMLAVVALALMASPALAAKHCVGRTGMKSALPVEPGRHAPANAGPMEASGRR